MNESKNNTPLAVWVAKNKIEKKKLFVDDSTSLEIKDFKNFIEARRKKLKSRLKEIICSN